MPIEKGMKPPIYKAQAQTLTDEIMIIDYALSI